MLSRAANNLFWMSRHIERAENTARLLDITYRMSLLPYRVHESEQTWAEPWALPLVITGLAQLVAHGKRVGEHIAETVAPLTDVLANAGRLAQRVIHLTLPVDNERVPGQGEEKLVIRLNAEGRAMRV